MPMSQIARPLAAALLCLPLLACNEQDSSLLGYLGLQKRVSPIGDAENGLRLIAEKGCKNCHTIPGVTGANGNVGPPLTRIATRSYIAGMLPNSPDNMMTWVRAPQTVIPGNAMPNIDLTDAEARDVAAYLYTLK